MFGALDEFTCALAKLFWDLGRGLGKVIEVFEDVYEALDDVKQDSSKFLRTQERPWRGFIQGLSRV